MTRKLRARAIAVAVVAATAALAAAAPGDLESTPSIKVIRHTQAMPGSGAIQLVNHGAQPIAIGSFSHACTSMMGLLPPSGGAPFTIPAGGMRQIVVGCPAALPLGMQRCTFTANDGGGQPLVSFLAVCETDGMPVLTPVPAAHDFGSVVVGAPSSPITLDIRNGAAMDVVMLQLQLDNPSFQIGLPCNPDAPGCDALGVGPIAGSGAPVTVTCKPVALGPLTASLYIAGSNGFNIPTPVVLTCTGTPGAGPVLAVMPPTVDVGPVEQLDATASASLSLANSGAGTLGITSVQIVDAGVQGASSDWSRTLSGTCSATPCNLAAGDVMMIDLTFDPSAIGARGATMIIAYNDGAPKTATVPLAGVGRGATLELAGSAALDFGVLPLNTAGHVGFRLANTGNRTLTDAVAVAMPAGPPFTVPGTPITVTTAAQTTVTLTCQSATAGEFTTKVRVSAPDVATTPLELTVKCEVRDTPLFADPSTIQLGEIRVGSGVRHQMVRALAVGPTIALEGAALASANPNLTLTGPTPSTTPGTLDLAIDPTVDGPIETSIVITPTSGSIDPVAVPVTGAIVTATYTAPAALVFGTFCVGQPTTSSVVTLTSTGTATLALTAPKLLQDPSPFALGFASPTAYPAQLAPSRQASVEITPKRRSSPGIVEDNLVWTTDVAEAPTLTSNLQATFIDAGVAVAPTSLGFPPTPIHIDVDNAQQITLRNCDAAPIPLGTPVVPSPFSMDSPRLEDFPTQLQPGETTTFRVGFHPTKLGRYAQVLEIASPALTEPLRVTLAGEGSTGGGSGGDDGDDANPARSSFYACGGCGTNHPSSWIVALVVCVLVWRRRAP